MKTIVSYIAVDGKSFGSKEACESYEKGLLIEQLDKIYFYDDDFNQLYINPKLDYPFHNIIDNSDYIVIKDYDQWKVFADLLNPRTTYYEDLISIIKEPGIYAFFDSAQSWISIKEMKKRINEIEIILGNY